MPLSKAAPPLQFSNSLISNLLLHAFFFKCAATRVGAISPGFSDSLWELSLKGPLPAGFLQQWCPAEEKSFLSTQRKRRFHSCAHLLIPLQRNFPSSLCVCFSAERHFYFIFFPPNELRASNQASLLLNHQYITQTRAPCFDGYSLSAVVAPLAIALHNKKALRDFCAAMHYAEWCK